MNRSNDGSESPLFKPNINKHGGGGAIMPKLVNINHNNYSPQNNQMAYGGGHQRMRQAYQANMLSKIENMRQTHLRLDPIDDGGVNQS